MSGVGEGVPERARAFAAYLAREPGGHELVDWKPLVGGRAAETVLVTVRDGLDEKQWVLRIEPQQGPTNGVALSTREHFDMLSLLAGTDVLAPRPVFFEPDVTVLGAPFMATDFTPGRVPSPWSREGRDLIGAEPGRSRMAHNVAAELLRIHSVTADEVTAALSAAQVDRSPCAELQRWVSVVERSPFRRDPLLAYTAEWLHSRPLAADESTLVHGDFRLGNLVLEEGSVLGVLDWEMSGSGDPLSDLALLCCPPVARDWARCGLGSTDDLVAAYELARGRPVERERLHALSVLATLKIVALWINGAAGRGTQSTVALRNGVNAVASRTMLIDALGLRLPAGAPDPQAGERAQWFADLRSALAADRSSDDKASPAVLHLLHEVPPPAKDVVDWFDDRLDPLERARGIDRDGRSVAGRLTAVVESTFSHQGSAGPDGRELRALVAAAGHLDIVDLPW